MSDGSCWKSCDRARIDRSVWLNRNRDVVRRRSGGAGPHGHVGQTAAHELVMPELSGDDRGQPHFHREARQRSRPQFTKTFSAARDLASIEVTGAAPPTFLPNLFAERGPRV